MNVWETKDSDGPVDVRARLDEIEGAPPDYAARFQALADRKAIRDQSAAEDKLEIDALSKRYMRDLHTGRISAVSIGAYTLQFGGSVSWLVQQLARK